jgi:enediyne biosynthesis protein E7
MTGSTARAASPVLRGSVPLLGALPALRRDPLVVLAAARELGDLVRLALPLRYPVFLLSDPAGIRRVFQDNHANYGRARLHEKLKMVLGEGLVTSEGELWRRQRRLLQPAFHAHRTRGFVGVMGALSAAMAERWEARDGSVVDVAAEMSELTLGIITRCMFGRGQEAGADAVAAAIQLAQERFAARVWALSPDWVERLPTPANRRFWRALATLDTEAGRIIAARMAAGDPGDDLLGMLLVAQAAGGDGSGGGIDTRQVRDEVMTAFIAGHETSATALTWTWHLLGEHPEVAERVRGEAAGILAGRATPGPNDLSRLPFSLAVIEEAMRLYAPVGWLGRRVLAPDTVAGHELPAGAMVLVSPYLVQRDPRLWPDPERFDPSRFAPGAPRRAPYAYFPFGGGPRACIGRHFAMTEMVVALAALAPRVRLRPPSDRPVRPRLLVTLRPDGGLPMRVERRRGPAP